MKGGAIYRPFERVLNEMFHDILRRRIQWEWGAQSPSLKLPDTGLRSVTRSFITTLYTQMPLRNEHQQNQCPGPPRCGVRAIALADFLHPNLTPPPPPPPPYTPFPRTWNPAAAPVVI